MNGVVLHYNNIQLHMAAAAIEMIQTQKLKFLPLQVYSPNLAPSDYHIFGPCRNELLEC